jgi:hypothetical protein
LLRPLHRKETKMAKDKTSEKESAVTKEPKAESCIEKKKRRLKERTAKGDL